MVCGCVMCVCVCVCVCVCDVGLEGCVCERRMCVCVCVCVCVSVYLPENEDLVSDILHSDSGRATKRGRPRIGEIVLMVANSTCIHMRMC